MVNPRESYRLLDAGNEQKLEMLGTYKVIRQAAQAFWPKENQAIWQDPAAVHIRTNSGGGYWQKKRPSQDLWPILYGPFRFQIKLTDFGHIGLFPEQLENWRWIADCSTSPGLNVLNLFGYTGGSTLATASRGASITHVDASKGAVSWARENAKLNHLADAPIRWIVEDVTKYIHREQKRKNRYQGIILDPPSYGRGPAKQIWHIERDLIPLLSSLKPLIDSLHFILLSCHTPGYSPASLRNILHTVFKLPLHQIEAGDMCAKIENSKLVLPSGTFARWRH